MATSKSSDRPNPFTPSSGTTQKLGDFLRAGGPSAKPPSTAGRSTGGTPQNKRKGA